MRGRLAAAAVVAAALAAPGVASADSQQVMIQQGAFDPFTTTVLVGDTVSWHNMSFRDHTVTARDGSFGSPGHIGPNGGYSFKFSSPGSNQYYCQLHPFMSGEVDVFPVLLNGPRDPVSRGGMVTLDGRAEPGTSNVEIQQDAGSGFATVATARVDASGAFHVTLAASASAKYRAVAAAGPSPTVQVVVVDRKLTLGASRHGRSALVRVHAIPNDPGATVALQLQLRERFGWWTVARRKLDKRSRAAFKAPLGARARVVLTLPDGWTPVVTSSPVRLPHRGRAHHTSLQS